MLIYLIALLIALQFWMLYHLYKQNGRLLVRLDNVDLRLKGSGIEEISDTSDTMLGLPVGTVAPAFVLQAVHFNKPLSSSELRSDQLPLLLIFSDVNCQPCSELIPRVGGWAIKYKSAVNIAVITRGERNDASVDRVVLGYTTLVQEENEVSELFNVSVTPSAVLIDSNGLIRSDIMLGSVAIERLLRSFDRARVDDSEPIHGFSGPPTFAGQQFKAPN